MRITIITAPVGSVFTLPKPIFSRYRGRVFTKVDDYFIVDRHGNRTFIDGVFGRLPVTIRRESKMRDLL